MKDSAQVVIIGGGIVGCSIAYHLTRMGIGEVILLEKGELTSGSTWHAAGLVGQLRSSPHITRMLQYSVDLYSSLLEETGQDTGWNQVGCLRLACSAGRMEEFKRSATLAKTFGFPLEIITPQEAQEIFPVASMDGVIGAVFAPTDGYIDPSGVTLALARGARDKGALIYTRTLVQGIQVKKGSVTKVITDKGDFKTELVINAAGMWAREIGELVGIHIPVQPMEHQFMVTDSQDAMKKGLPTLRDQDNLVYFKEEGGGFAVGGYEHNPISWGVDGIPRGFENQLLPPNFYHFEPLMDSIIQRIPLLEEAQCVKLYNGPEAFTPDGMFILGKTPEVKGFYIAAGFNAFGIAAGGGAGKMMAEMITRGQPSINMWAADYSRFSGHHGGPKFLEERTTELYARHYSISWPHEEMVSGREVRLSPVYPLLKQAGAVFGSKNGWERANYFGEPGRETVDTRTFGRANWFHPVGEEHRAVRERAGIIDQTSFNKFKLMGKDVVSFLQRVSCNHIDRPVHSIIYTQLLNEEGGIVSDLTMTRLAEDSFYLVTGTGFGQHDLDWLKEQRQEDESVYLVDVTSSYAVLTLAGPKSRTILEKTTRDPLANAAFPYLSAREMTIGYAPVLALRLSYVGELGWELHIPTEYAQGVYRLLMDVGKKEGLANVGYYAMESLRLEKGYRYWSRDITPEYTPFEAGLDFCVKLDGRDFLGKDALLIQKDRGIEKQLCCMVLDGDAEVVPLGSEPILSGDEVVGMVTSGGYGYTIGQVILYAYLPLEYSAVGTKLSVVSFTSTYSVTVVQEPLYDADNQRLRG